MASLRSPHVELPARASSPTGARLSRGSHEIPNQTGQCVTKREIGAYYDARSRPRGHIITLICKIAEVVGPQAVARFRVKKCLFRRWFVTLGIVAIPARSRPAVESVLQHVEPMTVSHRFRHALPQERQALPACSQKICPDAGTCLLVSPAHGCASWRSRTCKGNGFRFRGCDPASTHMMIGSLTPLLLRPPSA